MSLTSMPSPQVVPEGFALLRSPLTPMASWWDWTTSASGRELSDADRAAALSERLTPEFLDALHLASPSLSENLGQMRNEAGSKKGRGAAAAVSTLFARGAARSVPAGAFAGMTFGRIGETSHVCLSPVSAYRKRFMLDLRWVRACCRQLERTPAIHERLRYTPNPTLWRLDAKYRLLEEFRKPALPNFHWLRVATVDATKYIDHVLHCAGPGATASELAAALADFTGCEAPAARPFIDKLIDAQLLASNLQPPLTGIDPGRWLVERLAELDQTEMARELETVLGALDSPGFTRLGTSPDCYRLLESRLKKLAPDDVAFTGKSPLFVDLWKPAEDCSLGADVASEIGRAIELLRRIAVPTPDPLRAFRREFRERYETREMPLLEVLDEEVGLPLDSLLDRLPGEMAGAVPHTSQDEGQRWTARDRQLLTWVMEARERGESELRLDGRDLSRLENGHPEPLLPSFYVFATVGAGNDPGNDPIAIRGYMHTASMGRFAQQEPALEAELRRIAHREQEACGDGAILAEISHYPVGEDLNNILIRPRFLDYEIPIGCGSTLPIDRVIAPGELMVSVDRGTIFLRCPRLDREVIPRTHTAHRFDRGQNLNAYRFLCHVGQQHTLGAPVWTWGALHELPYLPRVTSGRVILAPARWRVERTELYPATENERERLDAVDAYRRRAKLPRFVILAQNDQRLPIDLDNLLSVRGMIRQTQAWPYVEFEEIFPAPDELWVEGPEGRYAAEWIVPFRSESTKPITAMPARRPHRERRTFPPGSEWVYAKLYLAATLQNDVLKKDIHDLVCELERDAWIDRWFFVRYIDPASHLRLRFHAAPGREEAELARIVKDRLARLVDRGLCWRVQYDTYEREMERYGGDGITWTEQVFHHDSRAVIEVLRENRHLRPDRHWLLAIAGLDALLNDFGYDDRRKHALMVAKRDGFREEFESRKENIQCASDLFRKTRSEIFDMLGASREGRFPSLRKRSESIAPLATERPVTTQLAASLCHMHSNRILRSTQRMQELVIYDLMSRAYDRILHGGWNHAA